ncbi:MAG: glycogen synthase GlgA [Marinobacter sp.]|nr:glycogen synthase GlgA [Marinobacter sp.]
MTRVLFVTSEVHPVIKTGGLADVSASLPEALCTMDHDVQIVLPGYPAAMAVANASGARRRAQLNVGGFDVTLWQTQLPGTAVVLWLVECPPLFDRPGNPYQCSEDEDWPDNAQRYCLFAQVVALMALGEADLDWVPDLVHCNDWQSGLVPVILDNTRQRPATVFAIHNLAYQGLFSHRIFQALELPDSLWRFDRLEFHDQLSFLKGGLVFSDQLTTVSPGYAREVCQPELGYGLDGLLRYRQSALTGILNGIDTRHWDPQTDPLLDHHYSARSLGNKRLCRRDLQRRVGLDANGEGPLLGFIGRMVEQKGIDLLLAVLPELMDRGCQCVILGSGMRDYEQAALDLAEHHPGQLSVTLGFNESLAHRITAGADLFIMPSRFEPCGLNQMYSMRYGTVPVVHRVGGLGDTVFDPQTASADQANGFTFRSPDPPALRAAIDRALDAFRKPKTWRKLQRNGMAGDYSWQTRAREYTNVYRQALAARQSADHD